MTTFGWDASHYDAVPDGGLVVAEGIKFMTHKAGGDANDAELAAWWKELKPFRGKVLLGAYWVLRNTDGSNAADAFLARLDSQCSGWRDGPFILQLDCEEWNGGATPAPTKAQIKECADRLRAKCPKLMPIVYAPKWVYGNDLNGLGYPLWASSYVSGSGVASVLYPGDGSSRWGAYSGQTPAVLQFSSSAVIAGQTTCDANAFRGTLTELTKLLAPGWAEDVEEDMALTAADVKTLANTDNVFKAPEGSKNADGSPNEYWSLASYVTNTYAAAVSARTYANQALSIAQALAARPAADVDEEALAAALAPLLNGSTEDEIKAALRSIRVTTTDE